MDGKTLKRSLREVLNEQSTSEYLNDRTSYDYLYQAAIEFTGRTACSTATQSITTVASTAGYDLSADFLRLHMKDTDGRFYIKYNDGSANTFVKEYPYTDIILSDQSSVSQLVPSFFTIIDKSSLLSQAAGTASAAGAASAGQCTLTDAQGDFTNVSAGDIVHNTTDGSSGIVLSKTSTTVLVTALFEGTNNDWTDADNYVIQPQQRYHLIFSPMCSTAGHTVTVYYIQKPTPVYSDYGMYRIRPEYMNAIVSYAAFLYKYRDREPNFGDSFFKYFDREVRRANDTINRHVVPQRKISVTFKRVN